MVMHWGHVFAYRDRNGRLVFEGCGCPVPRDVGRDRRKRKKTSKNWWMGKAGSR